ncbi:M48 family metallopeptidase [Frigidibacter oleivorans]|uniref:M48 family metallopeptidase n=1 Tax=Frigidibacter oleivorans TaxID=2487129 RepID=UPI000F8C7AB7|nr:SprT family zinc-dependent metalloprotease [Frigidibacter oleivorans]
MPAPRTAKTTATPPATTRLPGDPPLEITLRRSARARRFSLRVSRLDGRITLTLPLRAAEREAIAFARDREGWIRGALAGMGFDPADGFAGAGPAFGQTVPFEGRDLTLLPGAVRSARLSEAGLVLPADPARMPARLAAFLRLAARDRLTAACDRHAATLGRPYARITLRDPRSRWGSCTSDGALMFSWRLVMAPPGVLDYVAAHEVAHLAEMNHSPAFWAVVARLKPGYAADRDWLRRHGAGLHRLRLEPAA